MDVLEIDGASNNGVDNIRELRSNTQYMPQRARFKIYIIDEVHMLSKGAFNALLKTLEEPPPHVKFIFATTEVEKVPITILSRCQRFDFAGISVPRIVEHLREIVQREGMQADDEAIELVARRAGGSMRDAQSLLDQLLAFGGERLTTDQVHSLLGTAGDERIVAVAESVLAHEVKTALDLLDEAVVNGLQLGRIARSDDRLLARFDGGPLCRHRGPRSQRAEPASGDAASAGQSHQPRCHPGRTRHSVGGQEPIEEQQSWPNAGRDGADSTRPAGKSRSLCRIWFVCSISQRGGTAGPTSAASVAPPEGVKKKLPAPAPENGTAPQQPLTSENLPASLGANPAESARYAGTFSGTRRDSSNYCAKRTGTSLSRGI